MKAWNIVLVIWIGALCSGRIERRRLGEGNRVPLPTTELFEQRIDHFDHTNKNTFEQRTWSYDEYFDKENGPMVVYIEGEGEVRYGIDKEALTMRIAREYKAVLFQVEHRYYGKSQPVSDWSVDNLAYLSHDQGLADLAYFIASKKAGYSSELSRIPKCVVVGGSYAGALSAWMRYKYPHLVDGALASSGVVNALIDFYLFGEQVKLSASRSSDCPYTIRQYISHMVTNTEKNNTEVIPLFGEGTEHMKWDDFWFYYADIFVETIQYGHRAELCAFLLSQKEIQWNLRWKPFAQFAKEFGIVPAEYAFNVIQHTTIDHSKNMRQWTYQYCSALAYFNTPARYEPLRWNLMGVEYWRRYCHSSFGAPVFPNTFHTNSQYGDIRIQNYTSNIYFTNGGEDPWQWACVR